MNRSDIYAAIDTERNRQDKKWAASHPWGQGSASSVNVPTIVKVAVLTEEVGEVARAVLDRDGDNLRTELVQVSAVAVAWLESM